MNADFICRLVMSTKGITLFPDLSPTFISAWEKNLVRNLVSGDEWVVFKGSKRRVRYRNA